jgi:Minor capsid protein
MIRFNVRVELGDIQEKLQQAHKAGQKQLDQEVLKDSNNFIPKDTGELERSSIRSSTIGDGFLKWDTPYARRLYYNPEYNFSKDSNPNAQGLWFEAAKAQFLSNWIELTKQAMKGFLERG